MSSQVTLAVTLNMPSAQAEHEEELRRRTAKLQEQHKKRAAKRPEEPAASDHKQASAGPCLTSPRMAHQLPPWHMTRHRCSSCMFSC